MHLGRFQSSIYDIDHYYKNTNIKEKLNSAITILENYISNRDDSSLNNFKLKIEEIKKQTYTIPEELLQPYNQQIIRQLGITNLIGESLFKSISKIISDNNFDINKTKNDLKYFSEILNEKINHIQNINDSFTELEVEIEYTQKDEAEIGFFLPREFIGDKLSDLSKEFQKLNLLTKAIVEITSDGESYEPTIRTISSSWWEIFISTTPDQIIVWTLAIERIINLFKTNLEIKSLLESLKTKDLPKNITDDIEKAIEEKINKGIDAIAEEIIKSNKNPKDKNRLNELSIQLRQGLKYFAHRLNQGTQVEINLGIPEDPKDPVMKEGEEPDSNLLDAIKQQRQHISYLRGIRNKASLISNETTKSEHKSNLLIALSEDSDN